MIPLHRLAVIAVASAGALTLAVAGLEAADAPQPTSISWRAPPGDAKRGEQLAQPCLACHTENAPVLTPPAPRLNRQRTSYMVSALLAFRDGQRESVVMGPMVAGLKDQDIRDIAVYLSGQMLDKPPKSNEQHPYYAFARANCTMCHGESGIGEMEGMPVLTGQDPAYLQNALEEYRTGVRKDPTMRGVAAKLTPEEEKGMAAYFAQYPWLEKLK
jgi:cytochrome c553